MNIVSLLSGKVNVAGTYRANHDLYIAAKRAMRERADDLSAQAHDCYANAAYFDELSFGFAPFPVLCYRRAQSRYWLAQGDMYRRDEEALFQALGSPEDRRNAALIFEWMHHVEENEWQSASTESELYSLA